MRRSIVATFMAPVLAATLLVGCGSATSTEQAGQASEDVQETQVSEVSVESQAMGLTSVNNARELGGYRAADGRTVRHGTLLRTAALSGLSAEDEARLTDEYGLATIIDLRMTSEIASAPDPVIEDVRGINARIMDEEAVAEKSSHAADYLLEGDDPTDKVVRLRLALGTGIISDHMYVDWLSSDAGKQGYATYFEELEALPEGRSLLFHCTQGKDRTGLAAMLILSALGVDEDTIMQDYLLTNEFNAELIAAERKMLEERGIEGDEIELYLAGMDQVDEQYMLNALTWIKENYGTPVDYIKQELGVTEEQIQALQDKFLE